MKKLVILLIAFIGYFAIPAVAAETQHYHQYEYTQSKSASITFTNKSGYTLTLKILGIYGGLYQTVVLGPRSSKVVYFGSTATYKLKIKAEKYGQVSYHKGGNFSVTCNNYEWTEGEMSFQMSTYGSGLGPSISASEFNSNN